MLTPFSDVLVDTDECASNSCVNGGVCTDGIDLFTCTCAAGFMGVTCGVGKCIILVH